MKQTKKTFEVINVKCGGCASTLTTSLKEEFGEVEVNLDVEPRQITLDIEESAVPALRQALKKLGYPMSDEDLSKLEGFTTNAKSFVSCAVGKMNT
jgi:copper chaperone CopZ